ncbi:MAG: sugar phosphate isomerase/epimerase [Ruminococcaceae bacterium]|nr:sugar phosphate isomerase/epimerase [Oscillospiraceae bacterium]
MKLGTFVKIADLSQADEKFATLRKNGFSSCQLVYKPDEYKQEDAEFIKAAADKYDIEISAQFCGYKRGAAPYDNYYNFRIAGLNVEATREERLSYTLKAAKFASWLGVEDIIVHAGYVPNNPFEEGYVNMLTSIHILAQECKRMGLNVLFETGMEAPIVLLRLIQDVGFDNLYINYDPANIFIYGYGNAVDALRVFGKYVRNIHGKDGILPTDPRGLGKETPAGQGLVDFPKVFEMLKDLGYDRFITIEREITGEQQTKDILMAKEYFESLLTKLGYTIE